jgi:cobalt/nickel transport system permease protein
MMHLHALDTYRPGVSPVHQLDSRVKLVSAIAFIVGIALTPDGAWPAYVLLTALSLSVVVAAGLGVGFVWGRSVVALPFALAAVSVAFATPGRPLFDVAIWRWQVALTDAGLVRFVSIVFKAWLSVQVAIVLTATTAFPALLQAMRGLGIPKVLVGTFGFTYRYLFVIADEALRLMRARSARSGAVAGRGGGTVLWRARVTGNMAGSLFLRSLSRSERVYDAMVARGYDGEVRLMDAPALRAQDVVMGAALVGLLALVQLLARVAW